MFSWAIDLKFKAAVLKKNREKERKKERELNKSLAAAWKLPSCDALSRYTWWHVLLLLSCRHLMTFATHYINNGSYFLKIFGLGVKTEAHAPNHPQTHGDKRAARTECFCGGDFTVFHYFFSRKNLFVIFLIRYGRLQTHHTTLNRICCTLMVWIRFLDPLIERWRRILKVSSSAGSTSDYQMCPEARHLAERGPRSTADQMCGRPQSWVSGQ